MFSSVAAIVRIAMGAVATLIVAIFVVSGWGAVETERDLTVARTSAEAIAGPQLDLDNAIKDMQINVIQVQQWLTDISATRGWDGLNDGLEVAEEQAQAFARNAARAGERAETLGLPDLLARIGEVEAAFPAYYAAGKAMAARYIEEGTEAGNAMMGGFDAAAARLHEELDGVLEMNAAAVEARRAALARDLDAAQAAVTAMDREVLALGGAALAAIAVFAVLLFRSVVRPVREATAAARRLAEGDAESPIVVSGRLKEVVELADGLRTFRAGAEVQLAATTAVEAVLTPMIVVRGDGRPIIANDAAARLWSQLGREAGRWSRGEGAVEARDFSPLVAAVREAEAQGMIRAKPGGRRAVELSGDETILEVRMSPLAGGDGQVLEIENATRVRRLEGGFMAVIAEVGAGNFDRRVEDMDDLGFTSTAARGFNALCNSVARFMSELGRAVEALAQGDLSASIGDGFPGRFAEARDDFNRSVGKLRLTVQEVAAAAGDVNAEAAPISAGARDLATRTESQAAALEQMTATMSELGAALKGNAALAGRAVGLAGDATSGAETGAATVSETVEAVSRIEASSNRIRDIVNVIDSIAFQTNLLALNAAVEAARAGDAGKGFAVVASEVRQLAQRSSGAAEEVRQLIEESSAHVGDGVRLVHRTGETLVNLETVVRSVAATVTDISQSLGAQSEGLSQVLEAVREIDDTTQRNASLADQSSLSAGRLMQRAERLGQLVDAFEFGANAGARPAPMRLSA